MGVFDIIIGSLARKGGMPDWLTLDATCLKARWTAASLQKRAVPRPIGRTLGGIDLLA